MLAQPLQEPVLQGTEGDGNVAVEDGAKRLRHARWERVRADAEPHLRLVAGPGQLVRGHRGSDVDQGGGNRGDRDGAPFGAALAAARPVGLDAFDPAFGAVLTAGIGGWPLMRPYRCDA